MPTGRFYTFLVVALMMYFFANQTQVNWLYVTSALVGGVIPVAWLLNRGGLHNISGERVVNLTAPYDPIHEGDDIEVALHIQAAPRRTTAHIDLTETCPLLAPDDPNHQRSVFVPMLPAGNEVSMTYPVTVYQRGLYTFPPVQMRSRAPFGLFQKHRPLDVPSPVLVYPEVRPLQRLDFLDRQPAAQHTQDQAGYGSEVIGVRPYRSGDSPRHIHWRSVARTGRLISKEFAEETQPGVSIVIDRHLPPGIAHHPKYNPFEQGIKAAVSVAEYAQRQRYPVYLHADDMDFPAPRGIITWDVLMQYTARLPRAHEARLPAVIERGGFRQYVVVVVADVSADLLTPLIGLKHSGANLLVILPGGALADALRAEDVEVIEHDDL